MLESKFLYVGGRHSFFDDVLYLGYSASYVDVCFSGKKLEADILSDQLPDEEHLRGWIAIFEGDNEKPIQKIELKKGKHTYTLFEEKENIDHIKIRIMKYSEAAFASVGIVDFRTDGVFHKVIHDHKKKIEFVGDSITCGYGLEAPHELITFHTKDENPWDAYACKTARKCQMDFELISWSGNGIITHYVDPDVNELRLEKPLMPELYPYTDWELHQRLGIVPQKWEPETKPDIVVVNLGTNDCSYTREIKERNLVFSDAYKKFLLQVRECNPDAEMIVVCGIMDVRLNEEMKQIVGELQQQDTKLHFIKMPVQAVEDGRGADYHPSKVTHEKVSEMLTKEIARLTR